MESDWTDGRLDELNARVNELTKRTDRGFVEVRTEMLAGFERMEEKFELRFQQFEQRFVQMEEKFELRFEQVDHRLEQVDRRFELAEKRLEGFEARVERRFDGLFYSIIGFAASMVVAIAALVAVHLGG